MNIMNARNLFLFLLLASSTALSADELIVDFATGTWAPLERFLGPNDNPRDQKPEYTVLIVNGVARHQAPAAAPGARLTGFLEPPAAMKPIPSQVTIEWHLPDVGELRKLASTANSIALVGHYIRGNYDFTNRKGDWQGGMFGDWWGAALKQGDTLSAVLRNGNDNRVMVPITAKKDIGFRMVKDGTRLALWLNEDGAGWREAGAVDIVLNSGGSPAIAMSHFRVLDTSGGPVDVGVDRMSWTSPSARDGKGRRRPAPAGAGPERGRRNPAARPDGGVGAPAQPGQPGPGRTNRPGGAKDRKNSQNMKNFHKPVGAKKRQAPA